MEAKRGNKAIDTLSTYVKPFQNSIFRVCYPSFNSSCYGTFVNAGEISNRLEGSPKLSKHVYFSYNGPHTSHSQCQQC